MPQRRTSAAMGLMTSMVLVGLAAPPAIWAQAAQPAGTSRCRPTIIALPLPAGTTSGDVLSATATIAVGPVADDAQHNSVAVWRKKSGTWTVQDLGDFGISAPFEPLSATGVNAGGEVTIGVNADVMGGWLYSNGVIHRLKDFAGGPNAYVRAINRTGEMVGEALDAKGNDFAAKWMHWWSRPIRLAPTHGYDGSFAQGLNDAGFVVGGSFSNGSNATLPVRWSPDGAVTVLAHPTDGAEGFDINGAGRVVGVGYTPTGTSALTWNPAGHVRNLGMFAGDTFARAIGVDARGDVVGFSGANPPPPAVPVRHVLYSPGAGAARSLLPLSLSWADGAYSHALDDQGDVFGASAMTHVAIPQPTEWTCAAAQSFVPPTGAASASARPTVNPRVIHN